MQLASTVFGVCVIQIKPALEKLLNLPNDSLTKEIQLSQDLQSLFLEYQIPSDLLSYGGDPAASTDAKVTAVKGHVKALMDMVKKLRDEQVGEAKQGQAFRAAQTNSPLVGDFHSLVLNFWPQCTFATSGRTYIAQYGLHPRIPCVAFLNIFL
jgi:hypothetical protein